MDDIKHFFLEFSIALAIFLPLYILFSGLFYFTLYTSIKRKALFNNLKSSTVNVLDDIKLYSSFLMSCESSQVDSTTNLKKIIDSLEYSDAEENVINFGNNKRVVLLFFSSAILLILLGFFISYILWKNNSIKASYSVFVIEALQTVFWVGMVQIIYVCVINNKYSYVDTNQINKEIVMSLFTPE